MKITFENYGHTYVYENKGNDFKTYEVAIIAAKLMIAAGHSVENVRDCFADGLLENAEF